MRNSLLKAWRLGPEGGVRNGMLAAIGIIAIAIPVDTLWGQLLPEPKTAILDTLRFNEPATHISSVQELGEGRVLVVFDPHSKQAGVVLLGPDGRHQRIGRLGEGPGEFRRINFVSVLRDSVHLFDDFASRKVSLPLNGGGGVTTPYSWTSKVNGCRVLFELQPGAICRSEDRDQGVLIRSHLFLIRDQGGEVVRDEVISFDNDTTRFVDLNGGKLSIDRRHSWRAQRAYSPSLAMVAVADQLLDGNSTRLTITYFNLIAGTRNSWRMSAPAARPNRGQRRAIVASELEAVTRIVNMMHLPDQKPGYSAIEKALALPERVPAYERIHLGDDGCVWLRRSLLDLADDDQPVFDVYDFTGRRLRSVRVPARVSLSGVSCLSALAVDHGTESGLQVVRVSY